MRSVAAHEDLTTTARIRNAAIIRFGRDGFSASGIRAIAADAGVSPALVLHHFGSKDGLRRACDEHVTRCIRDIKTEQAEDPAAAMDGWAAKVHEFDWLRDYLVRAITDGSELAAKLLSELAVDAEGYLAQWEGHGLVRSTEDPVARAAYLTATSLGLLILRPLLARHLDVPNGPEVEIHLSRAAMDMYVHGLFTSPAVGEALAKKLQEET